MGAFIDMRGRRYEAFEVVARGGFDASGLIRWRCKCDCGNDFELRGTDLRFGNPRSCGCLTPLVNERICQVDSCGRQARGSADGTPVCSVHYQRWARRGSFDRKQKPVPPSPNGLCTVAGCRRPVQSRNSPLCKTHYFRVKRGSRLGLVATRDHCLRCSKPLAGNQSRYCSRKCLQKSFTKLPLVMPCAACGQPFEPARKWLVCSPACADAREEQWKTDPRTREQKKRRAAKRRAVQRGVQFEDFNFSEIFARDKWTCQICLTPVDRSKSFPHHLSPSIDHIVPLSKGGPHRRFNVQCAHWICNIRKSTKPMRRMEAPTCDAA